MTEEESETFALAEALILQAKAEQDAMALKGGAERVVETMEGDDRIDPDR